MPVVLAHCRPYVVVMCRFQRRRRRAARHPAAQRRAACACERHFNAVWFCVGSSGGGGAKRSAACACERHFNAAWFCVGCSVVGDGPAAAPGRVEAARAAALRAADQRARRARGRTGRVRGGRQREAAARRRLVPRGTADPTRTRLPGRRPPADLLARTLCGRYAANTRVVGWWRGTVVERRSLTGELSLSCARPAADG